MEAVSFGSAAGDTSLGTQDAVLITDRASHKYLQEHHVDYVVHLVIFEQGRSIDDTAAGREALQLMNAGAAVYVWCSDSSLGCRVASAVPGYLPEGMAARYIKECAPEEWSGTPPLGKLMSRASEQPPRAPSGAARVEADRYRISAQSCAELLLERHSDQLLIVTDEHDALSDLYVLDEHGVWYRGDNTLLRWMGQIANALRGRAVMLLEKDPKALMPILARIRRLEEPETLPRIRKEAVAAHGNLLER